MAEPFVGEIKLVGYNFAPRGWSFCSGQRMDIVDYQTLYALYGTTFGGDGRTFFNLPDLQGRAPIGAGSGRGLTPQVLGRHGGTETVILTEKELPQHTHTAVVTQGSSSGATVLATTEVGDSATPSSNAYLAQTKPPGGGMDKPELIYKTTEPDANTKVALGGVSGGAATVSVTNDNAGSNGWHTNMQPYLALNYIIALQGIFPSRN